MFNQPIDEIDYKAVKAFCEEKREEGLDLDYKVDWTDHLPRVICGMANVQGGMVLVGIKTDGDTKPLWPPEGVEGTKDQLVGRARNICYDGIYPPVQPEVQVCPLDGRTDLSVVVIRVLPSRLLHATDRRTRIYIRVADRTRDYELANLSQLEWLFMQRQDTVELRERIIQTGSERALYSTRARLLSRPAVSTGQTLLPRSAPVLSAYCVPEFPNPRIPGATPDATPSKLLRIAREVGFKQARDRFADRGIPRNLSFRPTVQGVFAESRDELVEYFELGSLGSIFLGRELFTTQKSQNAFVITHPLQLSSAFFQYADHFYRALDRWRGWVVVRIALQDASDYHMLYDREDQTAPPCQHKNVTLLERECRADVLLKEHDAAMREVFCSLVWAYGLDFENRADQYLEGLRMGQNP